MEYVLVILFLVGGFSYIAWLKEEMKWTFVPCKTMEDAIAYEQEMIADGYKTQLWLGVHQRHLGVSVRNLY